MMIRIKENLGEPTANDDDDIQVEMPNQDSSNQYKCPVTQRLIENPVRNKVCGHVYDLAGFRFWMRGHQTRKCPISGCTNATACESQLEEDVEFQMKLRRFVKRGEQERQNRMNQSQSQNLDQSFEEMDQPNFTVLE
jgi:SUMO ligase MMS21 Smc5/6 complex component